MVKNIRETILLLVLFVFAIIILYLTNNDKPNIEKTITVPRSCNVIVAININRFSKKVIFSELYSKRAGDLIKSIIELNDDEGGGEKDPTLEFIENIDDISSHIELLSLTINEQNGIFIRASSTHKAANPILFSSKDNYLYMQLYGPKFQREQVITAINNTKPFVFREEVNSDVQIYERKNNTLELTTYINSSQKKIDIHLLKEKNKEKDSGVKIKSNGLHFYTSSSNLTGFNSLNTSKHKIKNFSMNYFGLNIYENPILFPNTDVLIEFKDTISIKEFESLVLSSYKSAEVSLLMDTSVEGLLMLNDVEFLFRKINPNSIYLSTNNRALNLEKTTNTVELSGDLSQIFKLNDNGWKGILANEIISGIPLLNEIKFFIDSFIPMSTKHNNHESIITMQISDEHSIYAHLLSILRKI